MPYMGGVVNNMDSNAAALERLFHNIDIKFQILYGLADIKLKISPILQKW